MGGGGSRRSGEDKEKKRCGKAGKDVGKTKTKKMGKSRGKTEEEYQPRLEEEMGKGVEERS